MSHPPVDLSFPFTGDWLALNSPATRAPSHRTLLFALEYSIDFVPLLQGRTAPFSIRSLFRTEAPDRFPGFGREILAPIDGTVAAVLNTRPDHVTYRGLPSIGYALTQRRRLALGWEELAGNHVLIDHDGIIIALCHLQSGSIRVKEGDRVYDGEVLARCGNSGNSTEPHLHIQAHDNRDIRQARPVPISFRGSLPASKEIVSL